MNKIILLLFTTLLICSCSEEESNKDYGLLKKVESYSNGQIWLAKEVNYTQDSQVAKMTITTETFSTNIYDLNYENREAISLNLNIDYYQPTNEDELIVYNISYVNSDITLTQTNSESRRKIAIQHTDGFIDSYKRFYGENDEYYIEEIFTRNSSNDIESISVYNTNESGADIFVWKYTFLDFEENVNLASVYNPIFELSNIDLINILNLKISSKNPTKSSRLTGNQNFDENYRVFEFDSNDNGFVEKGILNTLSNSYEYSFKYY